MNNDYSKGMLHGHTDGKVGDNNLPSRAAKRLLKLDQLLPGAENRHDEYRRGYMQGFEDESRIRAASESVSLTISPLQEISMSTNDVRHNVPSQVHGIVSGSGGGQPRFDMQLEMLRNLKQYLQAFQEKLNTQSTFYQKFVDDLSGDGMIVEMHQKIEIEMMQTRQNLQNVISQIEGSDLPEVNKWIAYLENRPN